MNWQYFKQQLLNEPERHLQFQYAKDKLVNASYHLTEIKQAPITSVDCGGKLNTWTEVILQLWEPPQLEAERSMNVSKALSIIEIVENVMPIEPMAIVKIEFGNDEFATRQMLPTQILIQGDNLIVDLQADVTQCKAISRGESCGTTTNGDECCTPTKPVIQLVNLVKANADCCTPGSGCC
ncbi:DUF6428 family protein [Mucilaginibacter lacusdianchii]|uniref:DUF6428 family protein n=1 Tax=Mucilaginibacter lacusdianchii TaxID=2684211 RepID=UPI001E455A74|nr:DUF6428 family protein [Mucilaginibacter sp. JXJ CY 39]